MAEKGRDVARRKFVINPEDELVAAGTRRWLTYGQAGALLGVSGEAIRMKVRRGHIGYSSIGGRIYIDREEIARILEGSRAHATLESASTR